MSVIAELRLLPHLVRHFAGYGELAVEDVQRWMEGMRQMALAAAIAALASLFALGLAVAWILAATWNTDYRWVAFAVLTGLFVLAAVISIVRIRASRNRSAALFAALRAELAKDRQLFEEARAGEARAGDARSAAEPLTTTPPSTVRSPTETSHERFQ